MLRDADLSRFEPKVQRSPGCWEWLASTDQRGYGFFWWNGRMGRAHRFIWEVIHGAIPGDLTIDHLCRNKACVNPDHMELVTRAENSRRGALLQPRKVCCLRGHPLAGDNLYLNPKTGSRGCRTCRSAQAAACRSRAAA